MNNFRHLHVHTEYSFLDGASSVTKLIDKCVSLGMDSVAITDHGGMHGLYALTMEGDAKGVKIIPGCEMYVGREKRSHIILLAMDNVGLTNLYALQNISYQEDHFYYKPTVELNELAKYSEGIVCLSACIGGLLGDCYQNGDYLGMTNMALGLRNIYGNRFFLELQAISLPEQQGYNLRLTEISRSSGIPLVISNDPHYINREDYDAHEVWLAIQTNAKMTNEDRFRFPINDFWFKSEDEVRESLSYLPDTVVNMAIANTKSIADTCTAHITKGLNLLPQLGDDPNDDLALLVNKGYARRIGKRYNKEVVDRVKFELDVIRQKGYASYFIIVQDFINKAKADGILVGPGRGSAAGSEVAYLLGITDVDPLKYGLFFERFLNPERMSPPDIDSDFDYMRRDEMFEYLHGKYGADKTARVAAIGTLTRKNAVRRVLSVFDYPQTYIGKVTKASESDDLLVFYRPRHRREFNAIDTLEDNVTNLSMHAAGFVISPIPLASVVPMQTVSKNRKYSMTQWDKVTIEKIGLYKFDLLGLKTLSVLSEVLTSLNVPASEMSDTLTSIPLDDKETFDFINKLQMSGIFQLEGYSGKEVTRKMHPRNFEDLIIANAICRPGVKEANLYLERKAAGGKIRYEHPVLEEVLGNTLGCILFQEQIMMLMNRMAGWSLGRADMMRKEKDLEKHRPTWVEDCVGNGIDSDLANSLFDRFAIEYMFNRSHAAAYAFVTYWTAYFKCHHYTKFMAALLNVAVLAGGGKEDDDKYDVPTYLKEVKQAGYRLSAPTVAHMNDKFVGTDAGISVGLSSIANVGDAAIKALMSNAPFTDVADVVARTPRKAVNRKTIAHLIKAGVFDVVCEDRLAVAKSLDQVLAITDDTWPTEFNNDVKCEFEKEVYGMPITSHPLDGFNFRPFAEQGLHAVCGGIVVKAHEHEAKNGTMCFVTLETQTAPLSVTIFNNVYKTAKDDLAVGNIVLINGKKDKDQLIADKVRVLRTA